jgi:hypothetical protein
MFTVEITDSLLHVFFTGHGVPFTSAFKWHYETHHWQKNIRANWKVTFTNSPIFCFKIICNGCFLTALDVYNNEYHCQLSFSSGTDTKQHITSALKNSNLSQLYVFIALFIRRYLIMELIY